MHPYFSELVLSEVRLPQQLRSPRAWGEYNLKHMKQLMRIRFFAACIASLGTSCWRIPDSLNYVRRTCGKLAEVGSA